MIIGGSKFCFFTLQDPEVAAAFQDISTNPANAAKYSNNSKVQTLISKLANKFGGAPPGGASVSARVFSLLNLSNCSPYHIWLRFGVEIF